MATSTATTTMRAIVQDEYGDDGVWRLDDIAVPEPKPDEVLVRVEAAGLDAGTWHIMRGKPYAARLAIGLRRPKGRVPGLDLAGTVVAVGAKATRFAAGDAVYGIGKGSFAEYAVALERKLAPMPSNMPADEAAVVPVSGLTAIQSLDSARIEAGQHVLISGASGGVGSFAVQIAKARGAEVTAVCSADKAELVRSLGADHVVDYRRTDITESAVRFDAIVDIAGAVPVARLRRILAERGTLMMVGAEGTGDVIGMGRQFRAVLLSPFVKHRLLMQIASENGADIERLTALIEAGVVAPVVGHTFPLADAAEAMRCFDRGEQRGKIAISVQAAPTPGPAPTPTRASGSRS